MEKYDTYDRHILSELQRNGRITISELAERVFLSTSATQKRLRRLEVSGAITEYRAVVAPDAVDQGFLVYVQVKLGDTTRAALDRFNAAIEGVPNILACHMLTAGFDYLLKVRARDMHAFTELHGDIISALPGVQQTFSYPVMKEVKDTTALPVSLE